MRSFSHFAACLAAAALIAPASAQACSPPAYYLPPILPVETEADYRERIEHQFEVANEQRLEQTRADQFAREDDLWRSAEQIVAAEVTKMSRWRRDARGARYAVLTLQRLATERGRSGQRRFRLRTYDSGPMCLGPQGPVYPSSGVMVIFASEGAFTDSAVTDWTDANRTTHPATIALLERAESARSFGRNR